MRVAIAFLIALSVLTLRSIAPFVFPVYFVYILISLAVFLFFSKIDFEILEIFSNHFYIISIVLLFITLGIGQVTRGVVRWIPIGPISFQPTELVRPFLFVFFAKFVTEKEMTYKRFFITCLLFLLPFLLIWFQPSLGVAIVTSVGVFAILLVSGINKKVFLVGFLLAIALIPVGWQFLRPYQKTRIENILAREGKTEANYNSIQAMISVGSGQLTGRGLGEGVQTQLAFLPERHTDFIFASIAEELGTLGATLVILASSFLLYRIIMIAESTKNTTARAFAIASFMTLFFQTFIHIAMNMGLTPVTGLPLPLVSYGGSSLLASMTTYGILLGIKSNS